MVNLPDMPKLSAMEYRVVRPLGNGAGSTILLVCDKAASAKRYALKVVKRQTADDDVYVAQAQVEYQASQRLSHVAIVKIYDIRVKRSWFKVTGVELLEEFVDGQTLDEIEAPDMGQLVLVFARVASALDHMHRRGVYHGDLKPSNIMLSKAGEVKLIDFGTAWLRGEEKNRVQGTPQYLAPETASERVVDERTDLYNLGATMYRMFTGRYAQQDIPRPEVLILRDLVPPIQIRENMPPLLNALILACLAVEPDKRPASALKVKQKLKAVAKSLGLSKADLKGADEEE